MTGSSPPPPPHSTEFWDAHYAAGGNSGTGSYGRLAEFKAEILNRLLDEHPVESVIELGCGDGHQLSLIQYPSYLGLDTSPTAIEQCRRDFADDPTRQFAAYRTGDPIPGPADLAVSLDVIYHLLEDETFEQYMRDLFGAASRLVVVYSSDSDQPSDWPEVRHRRFTAWVEHNLPQWTLLQRIPNRYPFDGGTESSWADFYVYERTPPLSPSRRPRQRGTTARGRYA
ncbi:MAG: class I SAM-dependent methyltransferase [Acidimicrobiia bacterium]|nr:class I SAM-dependent methyltransferase [Acidimicrobiia bacterium]